MIIDRRTFVKRAAVGAVFGAGLLAGTPGCKTSQTQVEARHSTVVVAADGTENHRDIASAIADLPATGGCIYIKEGLYEISAPIVIDKDNVTLMGAGPATVIKLADRVVLSPKDMVVVAGNESNLRTGITISNIQIDGNREAGSRCWHLIECAYTVNTSIVNCTLVNSSDSAIGVDYSVVSIWTTR